MELFYFRRLKVYQQSKMLAIRVHDSIKKFPREELFALTDQLRRASSSIMFNIAEGFGRYTPKDRVKFLDIANGSLMEVASELELAESYGYISQEERNDYDGLILSIVKQIASLRASLLQ